MSAGATPPHQGPTPPPSRLEIGEIFFGKNGLRAGWSLLIYFALFVSFSFGAGAVARLISHQLHHPIPSPASMAASGMSLRRALIAEGISLLLTLFCTWIMSNIESRPNSVYGLGGQCRLLNFLTGLVGGVACLSLLILILLKTGFLVFDRRLLSGGAIVQYGALWFLTFLVVGLFEEYFTRGYLQYTLSRGMAGFYRWAFNTPNTAAAGFWTSAVAVSLLFGFGHSRNPGESPVGLLSAGLVSLVFCLSLWRTGSLWWAVGFHASWDWAQSFLFGVADSGIMVQHRLLATHPAGKIFVSGGTTGPEGSIFVLLVLAVAAAIVVLTLPRRPYPSEGQI